MGDEDFGDFAGFSSSNGLLLFLSVLINQCILF